MTFSPSTSPLYFDFLLAVSNRAPDINGVERAHVRLSGARVRQLLTWMRLAQETHTADPSFRSLTFEDRGAVRYLAAPDDLQSRPDMGALWEAWETSGGDAIQVAAEAVPGAEAEVPMAVEWERLHVEPTEIYWTGYPDDDRATRVSTYSIPQAVLMELALVAAPTAERLAIFDELLRMDPDAAARALAAPGVDPGAWLTRAAFRGLCLMPLAPDARECALQIMPVINPSLRDAIASAEVPADERPSPAAGDPAALRRR